MANRNLELSLRIKADLDRARSQLIQLNEELGATEEAGQQAGNGLDTTTNSAEDLRNEVGKLPALLRTVAGLLGVAFTVKEIAQAAEAYTEIRNRLALVTKSSEELVDAQDAVFQAAQNARQPLIATAELYQRIATNADALKLSGAGVAGVVDTINKTLAISGTSGPAASAALTQLGQAFASGTLRGEELNSVLEQAPALAKTLADGMGITVGQLRVLGQEGKLTAENVIQALQSQAGAVDEQFKKIQVTGGQALTLLANSLIKVTGELDSATGVSISFAETIQGLSEWLDSGVLTEGLLDGLAIWSATFSALIIDIESLEVPIEGVTERGGELLQFLIKAFKEMPVNLRASIQLAATEILSLLDKVAANLRFQQDVLAAIVSGKGLKGIDEEYQKLKKRQEELNQIREQSIVAILEERDAILEGTEADKKRRAEERKTREEARAAREKEIAALREKAKSGTVNIGGIDPAVLKDQEKYVKDLELKAKLIGATTQQTREYENAEKGLTGTLLERARAAQLTLDQDKEKNQLTSLRIDLLKAQGNAEAAAQLEFKQRYDSFVNGLSEGNKLEGKTLVDSLLNLETLNTRLDESKKAIEKTLTDLQRAEQSINVQREAGLISEYDARNRILELHKATYAELDKQRPLLEELAKQPGAVGEAAAKALADLDAQGVRLQATTSLLASTIKQGLEGGLEDAILGLADGTKSFGDAVKSVGNAVAQALAQMAAQALAKGIAGSIMGAVGGAGGFLGGLLGFADGGYTGAGGKYEVAGVVHKGEGVLSQRDVAALGGPSGFYSLIASLRNGYSDGGLVGVPAPALPAPSMPSVLQDPTFDQGANGGGVTNRIMNIVDPELVEDYLMSSSGDKVFINLVKRNTTFIQRIAGSKS